MKKLIIIGCSSMCTLKWDLKMKLTAFFLLICMLQINATTYSQKTRISLDMNNVELSEVLNRIETISEFKFFVDTQKIDIKREVAIKADKEKIFDILDKLFRGTNITYEVYKKQILLKRLDHRPIQSKSIDPDQSAIEINTLQQIITGTVTDENGNPLPGANILEKSTTNGTLADFDGNFSIEVADVNAILVVSYVGFGTKEITLNGQTEISVTLVESAVGMDEVVVVGYGSRIKGSLTGSVSTVDTENLALNAVGNITKALQGSVPGVSVSSSSTPGGDAKIRIRGLGTINNNNPLYVIDGTFATGGISQLSPSEIKSITVLKDAASTAIYGARGANGVVLITTLEGRKSQEPEVNLNVRVGSAKNVREYDMLDVEEYGEMLWLQSMNSGIAPDYAQYGNGVLPKVPNYLFPTGADNADLSLYNIYDYPITEANKAGTDWYDAVLQTGFTKEYNVTATGGSENSKYGLGFGYLDEEGIVMHTGFERYTFRVNIANTINNWLEIGENFGLSHSNDWGKQTEGSQNDTFGQLNLLHAISPIRDVMGNWAPISRMVGLIAISHPVAEAEYYKDVTKKNLSVIGSAYAKVNFNKNISFKTLYGLNSTDFRSRTPLEINPEHYAARTNATLNEASTVSRQWNWTNTLNYTTSISDLHNIDLLLGAEAIESKSNNISASNDTYFSTDANYFVLSAGEGTQRASGSAFEWSTLSYFGRLNYQLDNKYILDATLRHDASSRFGKENRWGTFPAFSLGWLMSKEGFMDKTENWLDYLKLRISWGQSGNDQIGNYNSFTTFRSHLYHSYYAITGSNNEPVSGFESSTFGNTDAKWETTNSMNFGLDASILNNLSISLDLWTRDTKDMLYQKEFPSVYGIASIPAINIGRMKNSGFDLSLNYDNSGNGNEFSYDFTANISHYKNEIVKLSGVEGEAIITDWTRAEKGTSFPEFYGYKVLGIFQTEEESDAHPKAFESDYNAPGHFKFEDNNGRDDNGNLTGVPDGKISDADRTFIGNPHPDFTVGFNARVKYRNIDLSALLFASVGNEIVNSNRVLMDFNSTSSNRGARRLYESWGSPYLENNQDAKMPIAEINDATSRLPSSYFIEDGSYLRLQTVQLGFNFPRNVLDKISLKKLRLYVMGSNLYTLSGYSGLDPAFETSDASYGVDMAEWPTPRRFTMGIDLTF